MNENARLAGIGAGGAIALYLIITIVLGAFWSFEPKQFDPVAAANAHAKAHSERTVPGYTTTVTAIELTNRLLDKPGGFLANDLLPPGVWLDDMPNFEEGVVLQLRDFALALRNDWSRPQSQSNEDQDLIEVQGQFQIDTRSWAFPSAEGSYRSGAAHLRRYLARLADSNAQDAQFYARADNLSRWLELVQRRLGSLTQKLSQSVANGATSDSSSNPSGTSSGSPSGMASGTEVNTAGATDLPQQVLPPYVAPPITSWSQRDDVFYQARGQAWALIHLLKAVQVDFAEVLARKNATVSTANIVRELEATQDTIWSPVILNGDGFGLVANHSLVMAAYLARANASVAQLRDLLAR